MVELGVAIDPGVNALVHALDRAVTDANLPGVRECVPTYRSLLVHYDPLVIAYADVAVELTALAAEVIALPGIEPVADLPATVEEALQIPAIYGGDAGPDLPEVARHAGLDEAEVVRRHTAGDYRVAMLGFAPGFPYLMGMDEAIACPRLETPRIRVPAGSVAIADAQTGIYPYAMPGGWRLIGRTALRLFDAERDPPATLRPGARVRFVPVPDDGAGSAEIERPAPRAGPSTGATPALRVVEAGFLTTVQDLGRSGFQRYGLPPSGAADALSLEIGNGVLANPPDAAALEITAGGVEFEFLVPLRFAIAGAELDATLAGEPAPMEAAVTATPGDRLRLGRPSVGLRTYVCLAGGIDVPIVLRSRSTYLPAAIGCLDGRALRGGDVLSVGPGRAGAAPRRPPKGETTSVPRSRPGSTLDVAFVPGGEWDDLAEGARAAFLGRAWTVGHQSDRIGLRLEGEPLPATGLAREFVSDGTVTGAIQIAGDGLPIVLLVDRQTTGGYPKLGAAASIALHLLAQARAGDQIRFRPISVARAQEAWRRMAARSGAAAKP